MSAIPRVTGPPIFRALWFFWTSLLESCRFRAYGALARVGRAIYGPSGSRYVQQLPFGMFPKLRYTSALEAAKSSSLRWR